MRYVLWLIQILLVPALAPLGVGVINKLKAKMQNRVGASIFQPYRNLKKLFHKDEVISKDASWVFRIAPFIVFGVVLVVAASIPLFTTALHPLTSDFLLLVYVMGLGVFFLALAGIDTGSAFGGFGSSREMTLAAVAEGALIFSLLPLVLFSGSTDLVTTAQSIGSHFGQIAIPIVLAFVAFFVVMLAEAKRYPFDNPDTHLELTMVHEAMLLEYSGKRLALMEWAAACKLFIFAALAVTLFFPVGLADDLTITSAAVGIGALLVKIFVVFVAVAVLESLISKLRFFRLQHLLFIALILNMIAVGLVL